MRKGEVCDGIDSVKGSIVTIIMIIMMITLVTRKKRPKELFFLTVQPNDTKET
jgi:hypothetical protein